MAGLLRYQVFLAYTAGVIAIWFTVNQKDYGIPNYIAHLFPIWVLLALALYAAIIIIYGVATLRDFSKATTELEEEVIEAKAAMKKRTIPVTESLN